MNLIISSVETFVDKDDFILKQSQYLEWFNIINEPFQMPQSFIRLGLNQAMDYIGNKYKTKRILAVADNKVVGFFVYANTTFKNEKISDSTEPITIVLSTAVHLDYRNMGIFNAMLIQSGITSYLVAVNRVISNLNVWKKLGCKKIHIIDQINLILINNENRHT